MNDDTLSPSELIYLYLDGEADTVQHATLFAALAHDPELQTEFQDALQMRLSLSMEVRQTLPPPTLKAALLQKATVGTQVASEAGAGVGISQAVSKTAGSVFALVKSVLVPILSVVAGVAIVTAGITTLVTSPVEQPEVAVVHTIAPLSEPASIVPEPSVSAVQEVPLEAENSVSVFPASVARVSAPVREEIAAVQSDMDVIELPPDDEPVVQEQRVEIDSAALLKASHQLATENEKNMRYMRSSIPEPFWFAESREEYSWSIYGRGIAGIQLFPWRQMESETDFASNLAFGALYNFNEEFAAGIEVGRENMLLYTIRDGNILEPQSTMNWVGLTGRYIPKYMILPGNIQPFVTGLLGATGFGPLAKSILGVRWQPDAHIGLSLGVEGTTLFYRYQQQWYSTQKIGISYGVEVQF